MDKLKENWLKIISFSLTGLVLLAGLFYTGYRCGRESIKSGYQGPGLQPEVKRPGVTGVEEIPLDVPKEIRCKKDNNCGVNICDCRAMNKAYIKNEDKICMRVCDGRPVCYQGRCLFRGEENRYQIEIK